MNRRIWFNKHDPIRVKVNSTIGQNLTLIGAITTDIDCKYPFFYTIESTTDEQTFKKFI